MKAMIFAAGLGTRLGKITKSVPKALVDINGKSVLHRAVEKCSAAGFSDIIINVHHFADLVEEEVARLNNIGYKVSVSDERDMLLENGGGLFKARAFFDDNPFLLYNVDIVSDLDLRYLYKYHIDKGGIATLAVRHRPGKRFLLIDSKGQLRGWRNVSTGEEILTSGQLPDLHEIAFSSMHIVDPEIFNLMNEGRYTLIDLYLRIASDENVFTVTHDEGYWIDIGTPQSLEYVRKMFKD